MSPCTQNCNPVCTSCFEINLELSFSLLSDIYSNDLSRPVTSATLIRDPFRYRHRLSPAGELSDKVIHTLRRNLESYVRRNFSFSKKQNSTPDSFILEYPTMAQVLLFFSLFGWAY